VSRESLEIIQWRRVIQLRVAMAEAEAWVQLKNPEEG
jgi:hypothetical protein